MFVFQEVKGFVSFNGLLFFPPVLKEEGKTLR